MQPLISVIVPVYNRENVLEECVNSVLKQTWSNLELVLIDDGSTDDSALISKALAEKDCRIRVLCMPHCGVSAARNAGLDVARGEYLFFLDSDDVIHPCILETLCTAMELYSAGIGGSDIRCFSDKNWHRVAELICSDQSVGAVQCHTADSALYACFRGQTPLNQIGGIMMRKSLAEGTRFHEDLFIGEDFWYIYENLLKGGNVLFLEPKWYFCRHHSKNSSWNYTYDGFWTRFYRRQLVWEQEEKLGREEHVKIQKQQAYGIFMYCQKRNAWHSRDSIRMRKTIKQYTGCLLPALSLEKKIKYLLALYLPWVYSVLVYIREMLK